MSWFNPQPADKPIRLPRQIPKRVVPSFIGESGQVLNLLMHHGAGTVVRDYSPYRNNGSFGPAPANPVWVDGSFGWALNFSVNDYIQVVDNVALRGMSALTILLWMNLTVLKDFNFLIARRKYNTGYSLYVEASGLINFDVLTGVNKEAKTPVGAAVVGIWQHIVGVYNGINLQIYVNSVASGAPLAQAGNCNNTAGVVTIGNQDDLLVNYFLNGITALPRIYNRALSQPEISDHFESTRTIYGV